MIKKNFMVLFIIGTLLLLSSNVQAAEDSTANTLDIEKTAIEAISSSQSVKDFEYQKKIADKNYTDSQDSTNAVLSSGMGNVIQSLIINPILAKNALDQFTTQKDVNTKTIILDAYSKYIALLKANYTVNIQIQLKDNLQKDYENARLQLASDLISISDERLVEINYLKAGYQLSRLQNDLDSAYMAINLVTGKDMSKRYTTLIDNNITAYKLPMTAADYVKKALLNRGETVNAQNTLNANQKIFDNTPSNWAADYEYYVRKAKYDIDNSQNNLEQAKIKVQLEIEKGYKTLEGNMRALESQQANYDLAESNYEAAQVQFSNFMITLNQFESVEVARAQAQMNLKNAELDVWLQTSKMNFASGIGPGLN